MLQASPKREFRATWMATVWQLDWPKSKVTETGNEYQINLQKKSLVKMLDSLQRANINAVFLQIRSRADVIFKSSYEPWSIDLVSQRGMDPGYDPLAFAIDEAHKRGLELHGWINPYRFESVTGDWSGLPGDYAASHPDWIISVMNSKGVYSSILDPGMPEVRQRISDIVGEVVSNYDIDGIVFDDYFYLQGISTQDLATQNKYNTTGLEVGDWRRGNVNKMIKQVHDRIQSIKPHVRFGVAPAGIWGGNPKACSLYGVTNPTGIGSGFAFNGIYCDPLAWLAEKTIDYISPQIYWTIGSGSTDYKTLSKWWADISLKFGRHCYVSHSISGMASSANALSAERTLDNTESPSLPEAGVSNLEREIWQQQSVSSNEKTMKAIAAFPYSEVTNQMQLNRDFDQQDAPGSVFYSTTKFYTSSGFINHILKNQYSKKALTPVVYWKNAPFMTSISNIRVAEGKLFWDVSGHTDVKYSVYAFREDNPNKTASSDYLLGVTYFPEISLPESMQAGYVFAVASLDKFGNEGEPQLMTGVGTPLSSVNLVSPAQQAVLVPPASFHWRKVEGADFYKIEISGNENFSELIGSREIQDTLFSSTLLTPLSEGVIYYWRVKAMGIGKTSSVSAISSFSVSSFKILSPSESEEVATLTPEIKWTSIDNVSEYIVEIGTTQAIDNKLIYNQKVNSSSIVIPDLLLVGYTNYYVRVSAKLGDVQYRTNTIGFKTGDFTPEIPTIIYPVHNSSVYLSDDRLGIQWSEERYAKGFRIELSQLASFPPMKSEVLEISSFTYDANFDNMKDGSWYLRVRSNYGTTYTDWSPVTKFDLFTNTTGLVGNKDESAFKIISENGKKKLIISVNEENRVAISVYNLLGINVFNIQSDNTLKEGTHCFDIEGPFSKNEPYVLQIKIGVEVTLMKFIY